MPLKANLRVQVPKGTTVELFALKKPFASLLSSDRSTLDSSPPRAHSLPSLPSQSDNLARGRAAARKRRGDQSSPSVSTERSPNDKSNHSPQSSRVEPSNAIFASIRSELAATRSELERYRSDATKIADRYRALERTLEVANEALRSRDKQIEDLKQERDFAMTDRKSRRSARDVDDHAFRFDAHQSSSTQSPNYDERVVRPAVRDRDHPKQDTLEGAVDPTVLPSDPILGRNDLGFHSASLRPGQDQYSPMPPAPPVTPDPSTSRTREGSFSRPSINHEMAPPIAGTASVPGSAYRDVSHSSGEGSSYSHRGDGSISISRPPSTPISAILTSWSGLGFANTESSMSSLGPFERSRDVSGTHSQAVRPVSTSIPATARDRGFSSATAESTSAHVDLFSTLRGLEYPPASGGLPSNDLLPSPDGQLLGVVRAHSCPFHCLCSPNSFVRADMRQSRHRNHSFRKLTYLQWPATRTAARTLATHSTRVLSRKRRFPLAVTPPNRWHHHFSLPKIGDSLMPPCHRHHHLKHLFRCLIPHINQLLPLLVPGPRLTPPRCL